MKIKDRYFENELIAYIICLIFGLFVSYIMTMVSIDTYYLNHLGFGFVVVIAFFSYIWSLVCIVIGIREIIVIRNNQILQEINNVVSLLDDEINLRHKIYTKLFTELEECKKMKK